MYQNIVLYVLLELLLLNTTEYCLQGELPSNQILDSPVNANRNLVPPLCAYSEDSIPVPSFLPVI